MVKLTFDKMGYDPNGLHEELGDLGEKYLLTHNEAQISILFPDIYIEKIVDIVNEEEIVTEVYYKKNEIQVDNGLDEEGNTIITTRIDKVPFDFATLEATINNTKILHDPLKRQNKLDNEQTLRQIKETDSELVRGLEDLYTWAQTAGFTPAQAQLDRITERTTLRSQLKGV